MRIQANEYGTPHADERGMPRRSLRLDVQGASLARGELRATIYNMSATGILIQTDEDLAIGEIIDIALPDAKPVSAQVMWLDKGHFGCAFRSAVSAATISAVLLRAPFEQPMRADPAMAVIPDPRNSRHDTLDSATRCAEGSMSPRAKAWTILSSAVLVWLLIGTIAATLVYFLT